MDQPVSPTKRRPFRDFWWNRLRPFWLGIRWPLIGVFVLLTIGLGYWGFDLYLADKNVERSALDKVYLALQLFPLESGAVEPPMPWQLTVARLLGPAAVGYAFLSAIAAIFREQFARARVRLFAREHVLICGLGSIGSLLGRNYASLYRRVVVIEKDEDNPDIGRLRRRGISVLVGDATDPTFLRRVNVRRAARLFAVTAEDAVNAKIALDARRLTTGRKGTPLLCFTHLLNADLVGLLQQGLARQAWGGLRLEVFNPAERGAEALLDAHPPFDEQGTTPFGPPHLLIVGLGQMGSRLVLHAARRWRAIVGPDGGRFKVTVVDDRADEHVAELVGRQGDLTEACAVTPFQTDVDAPHFETGPFLYGEDGRLSVTGAYVSLGDDALGLEAALRLQRRLRDRPIVVRTQQRGGLGGLVGEDSNLRVFGLLDLVCRPDVLEYTTTEILARAIHEDYIRHQRGEGQTPRSNPSMVPWEELPERLKESNRAQAADIGRKLQAVGCDVQPASGWKCEPFEFSPDEEELLSQMEHERWQKEREDAGWTNAPEKDANRKRSPHLISWEDLPEEVKQYDRNTIKGLPEFLARVGLCLVRLRGVPR